MEQDIRNEWRCINCRRMLFKYDDEITGFFATKCRHTDCGAINEILFYKGEGYPINDKLLKRKEFLKKALSVLPQPIVNDIMSKIS